MSDASDVHEAIEAQADSTFLRQISQGVNVRLSDPLQIPKNDGHANLLAVSNQRGVLFASTNEGFLLHPLKDLRQEFKDAKRGTEPTLKPLRSIATKANEDLGERVTFLRIADQEQSIVVGLANGRIAIWSIEALQNSNSASPSFILQPPSPDLILREVAPNPSDRSDVCAVIFAKKNEISKQSGSVAILNLRSGIWQGEISAPDNAPVTSISWSVKGKQLALGLDNGQIAQVTPEGELKSSLPKATNLSGDYYVDNILWLENNVFFVTYNAPQTSEEPEHAYEIYALLRDTSANNKIAFVHFVDPAPPFGDTSRRGHRYVSWLKAWQPMKHMLFMANTSSTDVGLLGCSAEKTGQSAWEVLELEDTSRPALPFSSLDKSADTSPIGLEMDVTSEDAVDDPQAAARGEDGKGKLSAVPILLVYTNDGVLLAYHIINTSQSAGKYTHMVIPGQQSTSTDSAMTTSTTLEGSNTASAPKASAQQTSQPAFGQGTSFGFGQTSGSSQKSSFGQGSGFGQTSGFGSGSFGSQSGTSTPSFGQSAQIGAKPASAFSAFSKSGTSSPVSGGFGAFATKANATGFGASTSTPSSTDSVLGQSSAAGTGSQQTPASTFGQSSGFGAFANKSDNNPFAQSTTSNPNPSSAFGGSSTAFSNTSAPAFAQSSAFGSLGGGAKPGAFGQKAQGSFASSSAFSFGQGTSTPPKPSTPGTIGAETNGEDSKKDTGSSSFGLGDLSATLGAQPSTSEPPTSSAVKSEDKKDEKSAPDNTSTSTLATSTDKVEDKKSDEKTSTFSFGNMTDTLKDKAVAPPQSSEPSKSPFSFAPSAPKPEQSSQPALSAVATDDKKDEKSAQDNISTSTLATSTDKVEEDKKSDEKQSPFSFGNVTDSLKDEAVAPTESPKPAQPTFSFAPSAPKSEEPSQQAPPTNLTNTQNKEAAVQKSAFSFASSSTPKIDQPSQLPSPFSSASTQNKDTTAQKSAFSFAKTEQPSQQSTSNEVTTQSKEAAAKKPAFSFTKTEQPSQQPKQNEAFTQSREVAAQKPAFSFAKTEQPSQQPKPNEAFSQSKEVAAQRPAFSFAKTEQSSQQPSLFNGTPGQSKDAAAQKPAFSFAKTEQQSQQPSPLNGAINQSKEAPAQKPTFSFASSKPIVPNEGSNEPFKGFSFAPTSATPKKEEEVPKKSTTPIASPSLFLSKADNKPKAAVEQVTRATPIPAQVAKPSKPISSPISNPPKFSVPAGDTSNSRNVQGQGLQEVFLHTYETMAKELDILKKNVENCAKFQSRIRKSNNELLEAEDLANPGLWTFGELESKSKIAQSLLKELEGINESFKGDEFRVRQLRAEQVKVQLKQEEIERFLRAKSDPDFGKMIKVRQLGPEHTENQHKLRRGILDLRQALVEFDGQLDTIRRSVVDARLGKAKPMEVPSIDRINRSVRYITQSAEAKLLELKALELTYESLFNTRSNNEVRELNGLSSLSLGGLDDQSFGFADNSFPSLGSIASHLPSSTIKQDQDSVAHRAYERHKQADKIRDAFLRARKEPVLNTKMRRNNGELKQEKAFEASDLDMVFAKGTVNLDENRQERMTAAREREEAERVAKAKKEEEEAANSKKAAENERAKAELQASEFAKSYASLSQSAPKFAPTPFTTAEAKANNKKTSAPTLNFAATLPPGALDFSTSASFSPRSSNSNESSSGQNSLGRPHHSSKSSKRQPAVTLQAQQPSEIPSTFKADFFAMPSSQEKKPAADVKPFSFAPAPAQSQNEAKENAKASFGIGAWSPPFQPRNEIKNGISFAMNNNNSSFSSFSNAAASSATTFKGLQNLQPISKENKSSSSSGATASTQPFSFARSSGQPSMDDVDDDDEGDDEEYEDEDDDEGLNDDYEDDDDDPDYSDVDEEDHEEGLSAVSEGDEEEEE